MKTVPEAANPQVRAVAILAEGIRVLQDRDRVPLTEEQITERARNAVAALRGDFNLVPTMTALADLQAASREMRAAADDVRALLAVQP